MNPLPGGNPLLALAAAILWGGSDFTGGMGVKRAGGSLGAALRVVLLSHTASFLVLLAIARLRGDAAPHGALLAWGIAAGVSGGLALTAFYIASRAAPWALGRGQRPSCRRNSRRSHAVAAGLARHLSAPRLRHGGMAIWLIAASPAQKTTAGSARHTMALAVLAGSGFGFYFIALKMASPAGVIWPMASARIGSLTICSLMLLTLRLRVCQVGRGEAQPQPRGSRLGAGNRPAGHLGQSSLCGRGPRRAAGCRRCACFALSRVHHTAGGACAGRVAHPPPGPGNGRRRARRRPHRAVRKPL